MKHNNFLIRVENTETGEVGYFTKDTYVARFCGCSVTAVNTIKAGCSKHFQQFKYEIVDGSNILYKDINNV